MNHNEEMKLLGYLKKIADNTGRIADALEKRSYPLTFTSILPDENAEKRLLSARLYSEDSKPCGGMTIEEDDSDEQAIACAACAYISATEVDENGVEYDPCGDCRRSSNWKSRRSST